MKLLVICGPTASGKSELALACAERLGGEIVSADAFSVYRGLNIGTAKPSAEALRKIPHHMIDIADPRENFSVSDYERMAVPAVEAIAARGKVPVIVGGTGFYMNSVLFTHGYGAAPASEEIRKKYETVAREEGVEALHRKLAAVDSESAQKLHPNDVKRVIRALEIYEQTGRRKSEQHDGDTPRYPFEAVCFDYPRAELYERIRVRTERMLEAGLVEEVRGLLAAGVSETAQSMQAIGYKEVVEYLKNGYNQSTLSDIIQKNTRNYAKRQCTFFKRTPNLHRILPKAVSSAAEEVIEIYESGR